MTISSLFSGKNPCFAEDTLIMLEDHTLKLVRDIVPNDRVLVSIFASDGNLKLIPSAVLTKFEHHHSWFRLVSIDLADQPQPLRVTSNHLLLVQKSQSNLKTFEYASDLSTGDYLFSSTFESRQILDIKEVLMYDTAVYSVLTFEGTIVTNHSIASCYGTYPHRFMHALTTPVRWWFRILQKLSTLDFLSKLTNAFLTQIINGHLYFETIKYSVFAY